MNAPVTAPEDQEELPYRYDNRLAAKIEAYWQQRWADEGAFEVHSLPAADDGAVAPHSFVLDMFPYPSGSGLHVGHPLGYIATDVYARYLRMTGQNVLHSLGYDAFGLPAEQYAVQTGTHPRITTQANIRIIQDQLRRLGLGHDPRRAISTMDPGYYKWTQWIFLQLFNSWYDVRANRARPIAELEREFRDGDRPTTSQLSWSSLSPKARADELNQFRLAYLSEAPVNWCPGLGTVLANEEVTAEGKSERGDMPVFRARLRQWMMRITAYADRLLTDLDPLDWPESIKAQQRNWIGKSTGAEVIFTALASDNTEHRISVFTTRPDTLWGATYMVLAPEHPLLDVITSTAWPVDTPARWASAGPTPSEALAAYRATTATKSDMSRQLGEGETRTGIFTGAYAINPVNEEKIPVFTADYVLMEYGSGAIMAVPAHDSRDFSFAKTQGIPIRHVIEPTDGRGTDPNQWRDAFVTEDSYVINSSNNGVSLDNLPIGEAQRKIVDWLSETDRGRLAVNYKLRDWLFSRQRYWGEPFPIVYDEDDVPYALPLSMLPVVLPDVDDYSPCTFDPEDAASLPESPLARARDWRTIELDLGDGPRVYRRETDTMPNWAGSCWYELRYLDPSNTERFVDPAIERYWMGPTEEKPLGGVDLYVGGAEHAVLHLLYARFWHKVLFDLEHVSSAEPFHHLVNQGMIQAYVYRDARGVPVPADEVEFRGGAYWHGDSLVTRELGKMGKSLKNGVSPEVVYDQYGADTLRVYEMSMGPLDVSRPWDTRSITGAFRLLQRVWRNVIDEKSGEPKITQDDPDEDLLRRLHLTIAGVRADMAELRFHTAIAKLTEFNNHLVEPPKIARVLAETLVLLLAPFAPYTAEELWKRLGHNQSLGRATYPQADPRYLVTETVKYAVQVNGKLRGTLELPANATETDVVGAARGIERVTATIGDSPVRRTVFVHGRTVNFVV